MFIAIRPSDLSCREKDDLLDQMQAELRSARLEAANTQGSAHLPGSSSHGGQYAEHARMQQLQARNAQLEVRWRSPVVLWQLAQAAIKSVNHISIKGCMATFTLSAVESAIDTLLVSRTQALTWRAPQNAN